MSFKRVFH